jgi:hypothetical protein
MAADVCDFAAGWRLRDASTCGSHVDIVDFGAVLYVLPVRYFSQTRRRGVDTQIAGVFLGMRGDDAVGQMLARS